VECEIPRKLPPNLWELYYLNVENNNKLVTYLEIEIRFDV